MKLKIIPQNKTTAPITKAEHADQGEGLRKYYRAVIVAESYEAICRERGMTLEQLFQLRPEMYAHYREARAVTGSGGKFLDC